MDKGRVASELRVLVDMGWKVHWWREKRQFEDGIPLEVCVIRLEPPGGGIFYGEGDTHGEAYEAVIAMYRDDTMSVEEYRESDA